jgi:predicted transcriptional regulator
MTTLTIPKVLEKRLRKVSTQTKRSVESLVRNAITDRLDYLEGRIRAIDAGFDDLARGNVASTTEVLETLDKIIQKHARPRKKAA